MRFRIWPLVVAAVMLNLAAVSPVEAQYFGRNKVQYRTFDFKILKTEHFDLYYYPEEADAAQIGSRSGGTRACRGSSRISCAADR